MSNVYCNYYQLLIYNSYGLLLVKANFHLLFLFAVLFFYITPWKGKYNEKYCYYYCILQRTRFDRIFVNKLLASSFWIHFIELTVTFIVVKIFIVKSTAFKKLSNCYSFIKFNKKYLFYLRFGWNKLYLI